MPSSNELVEELHQRWQQQLAPFTPSPDATENTWNELAAAYTGPDRHYHNFVHIGQMLDVLEDFRVPENHAVALDLSAWFHDAVYDTHATDNEERSADLAAQRLMGLGVPMALRDEVGRLILLTKQHQTNQGDIDGQLLLDADLAILGAGPDAYQNYAAAIRQEYFWVPSADFRAGREQFLRNFLRREKIYQTARLRTALESAARENLQRELNHLTTT